MSNNGHIEETPHFCCSSPQHTSRGRTSSFASFNVPLKLSHRPTNAIEEEPSQDGSTNGGRNSGKETIEADFEALSENVSSDEANEDCDESKAPPYLFILVDEQSSTRKVIHGGGEKNRFKLLSKQGRTGWPGQEQEQVDRIDLEEDHGVVRNLFYLKKQQKNEKFQNNIAQINHEQLEYECIDPCSPTQKMRVDIIKVKERLPPPFKERSLNPSSLHKAASSRDLRNKSLIYISHPVAAAATRGGGKATCDIDSEIRNVAQIQGFYSYEQVYNSLTEKFIGNIVEGQLGPAQVQNVLLMGETESQRKCKQSSQRSITSSQKKCAQIAVDSRQKEEEECTFQPHILKSRKSEKNLLMKTQRSAKAFYEDQLQYRQNVENKILEMKQRERKQGEEEAEGKARGMSEKSKKQLFDRLVKREDRVKEAEEKENTMRKSSSRKRQEVVDSLYTDYFVREQSLKALQCSSEQVAKCQSTHSIDFSRTNQILAQKLSERVASCFKSLRLSPQHDLLSFFDMVQLLTKLGYIGALDAQEKQLLNRIWALLTPNAGETGQEVAGVSLRNMTTFLCCLENLFVESMQVGKFGRSAAERREFGWMVRGGGWGSEAFLLEGDKEAKKVQTAFAQLYVNKMQREKEEKSQRTAGGKEGFSFRPSINERSQAIAEENLRKLEAAFQEGCGDPTAKIRHEDLLICKGRLHEERVRQLQESSQSDSLQGCTFSPQIGRQSSPTDCYYKRKNQNVFSKLYEGGRIRYESRRERPKEQVEFEKGQEECTFKPNLDGTLRANREAKTSVPKKIEMKQIHQARAAARNKCNYSYNMIKNKSQGKLIKQRVAAVIDDSYKSENISKYLHTGCYAESTSYLIRNSNESLNADLIDCLQYQSVINSEKNDLNFL